MDVTYFEVRLKRSIHLAKATADICARRSHEGLARLYRQQIKAILAKKPDLHDGDRDKSCERSDDVG